MNVYVSMLRGVNVGGHARVKMSDLKALYESLGFADVHAVLQSGNVLFISRLADRVLMARRIHQEIERKLKLKVDVVLRTLAEVERIVERCPQMAVEPDPSKLLVMFLAHVPQAADEAKLLAWHKGSEMLELRGPEIYLYYPNGYARSRLTTAAIEDHLRLAGTARNWNTLSKLIEMGRQIMGRRAN